MAEDPFVKEFVSEEFELERGITTYIEYGSFDAEVLWENKEHWEQWRDRSHKEWNALSDERKAAVVRMLRRGTELAFDNMEWVADALEVVEQEEGKYLDFHIKIFLTEVGVREDEEAQSLELHLKKAEEDLVKFASGSD